jgi:hypothetical protein
MKVFISWSGDTSRAVADRLREWLPCVMQDVEPWISTEDIRKGTRWTSEIAAALDQSRVGILCLTSDNLDAPWLHFEAGALSKAVPNSAVFVCTFLYGVEPTDVGLGPLAQFQHTKFEKEDTFRLIKTLNNARDAQALDERLLRKLFDKWWPDLHSTMKTLPFVSTSCSIPRRSDRAILEDIWELVREQARTQQQLAFVEDDESASGESTGEVVDLMEALRASLAARPVKKRGRMAGRPRKPRK